MSVAGSYDTMTKSPMGDQKGTLTVTPGADGTTFTGTLAGGLGSLEEFDGKIDGNTLAWRMEMTVPMPLSLNAKATVDGDTISGTVNAGAFGDMPISGTRVG